MEFHLRKLEASDISGLVDLSAAVGWDYDEAEINTVMSSGVIYGYENKEGKIISSAAIIKYENLASLGMVIVRPDYQGMGLGKAVTQKCIQSISDDTTIMLIATEEGKPMYEKMGFHTVDYVQKFICESYESLEINSSNIDIKPLLESDLSQIIHFDRGAFGDRRGDFLIQRIEQSKDAFVAKSPEGEIRGYGLSILGPENLILGPIAASDTQTALALVDQLAKNHQGKLRIDVPSGKEEFVAQLEKSRFHKVSQPPIMIKNANQLPARNQMLYSLAAQVFG